jgi:hypothetical protein
MHHFSSIIPCFIMWSHLYHVQGRVSLLDQFSNYQTQAYFFDTTGNPHTTKIMSSVSVAIVMPLHEPKFPQAKRFVDSLVACGQARDFAFYPVLSDNSTTLKLLHYFSLSSSYDLTSMVNRPIIVTHPEGHWCFKGLRETSGCNRHKPEHGCMFSTTACICARKKLLAMKLIFTSPKYTHQYALSIDGDSEFQSRENFTSWFMQWSVSKEVIGWPVEKIPPLVVEQKRGVKSKWTKELLNLWWARGVAASCNSIHQPNFNAWTWWGNAPVYERKDFEDFFNRIDFESYLLNYGLMFDHMAYMCYKVGVKGWKLKLVETSLEFASVAEQDAIATTTSFPPYFLWSMEVSQNRLLRYNMDRKGIGNDGLNKRNSEELKQLLDTPLSCAIK